jgi:hypothetical protein
MRQKWATLTCPDLALSESPRLEAQITIHLHLGSEPSLEGLVAEPDFSGGPSLANLPSQKLVRQRPSRLKSPTKLESQHDPKYKSFSQEAL